jgi:hypothetical protein
VRLDEVPSVVPGNIPVGALVVFADIVREQGLTEILTVEVIPVGDLQDLWARGIHYLAGIRRQRSVRARRHVGLSHSATGGAFERYRPDPIINHAIIAPLPYTGVALLGLALLRPLFRHSFDEIGDGLGR